MGEFLITYLRGGGGSGGKSFPTLAIPWTGVHYASLSKGFPRQEYWSGLPFPSPGDLPDPGIRHLGLLHYKHILYHLSHHRNPFTSQTMKCVKKKMLTEKAHIRKHN